MIQTIKVLIGIAILYGALLFTFYSTDFGTVNLDSLKTLGEQSLQIALLDQNFRTQVVGVKNDNVSGVSDLLKPMLSKNFSIQICDQNNQCHGSKPGAAFVTVSRIMDSESMTQPSTR